MNQTDIEERVRKAITDKLGVEESKVTPEASFVKDLGADSLDTVELIMQLEQEFDIKIPDEDSVKIQTVGNAISYVSEKVSGQGA